MASSSAITDGVPPIEEIYADLNLDETKGQLEYMEEPDEPKEDNIVANEQWVRMDVRKPLKRKMRIKMPKDWVIISFKYERLGAQWSRLEVIAQGGGNTDKARAFNSPTFRGFKQNQMPNFGGQPMDKMVGDKGNGKKGESVHGKETSMEGSVLEDKDDDLIVTDPKCRRQDPEDSVAVNESLDTDNSKNGCGAGSGSQARQSL
ncbi:hypothetical protein GH714_013308 [Hevea brasiliensis]|uniref:Zinc knuckle CX2CX4HX4C domain-containing protein n=1 Tax=Hevea brasiliensis TaxID=3981 RepID=A0A6A6KZW1_HEVBR|nr:hypothetical protein GH714_013308 [Hevea brasiliensis]